MPLIDEPRVSEKRRDGAQALAPEALHDVEGVSEVFRVHRSSIPACRANPYWVRDARAPSLAGVVKPTGLQSEPARA